MKIICNDSCITTDLIKLPNNVYYAELIEWNNNPECWANPYSEKYTLVFLSDYSGIIEKTDEQLQKEFSTSALYSTRNLPHPFDVNEFVECKGTLTEEKLKKYIDMQEKNPEFRWTWKKNIDNYFNEMLKSLLGCATTDRPYKIQLKGTDDVCYGLSVETKEKSLNILNELKTNPTWDNLKQLGFIFL